MISNSCQIFKILLVVFDSNDILCDNPLLVQNLSIKATKMLGKMMQHISFLNILPVCSHLNNWGNFLYVMMPNRSYSYSHPVLTCHEINPIQHTNQCSVSALPVSQMQDATFLLIAMPAWIQSIRYPSVNTMLL